MTRWGVTFILMLAAPLVFSAEVMAVCALLDAQMGALGKALTIAGGLMCSFFVFVGRHG